MNKTFKTYRQQLSILRSRGLNVSKNGKPMRILENENYYKIINGYKDPFIDNSVINAEQYCINANFSEIVALYNFDREIRFIFLKSILILETKIKSIIAYEFSKSFGHDNYLKKSAFNDLKHTSTKPNILYDRNRQISELIAGMQKYIADESMKKEYIKHYLYEYGYVPLWVLINTITLGSISKFFHLMQDKEKFNVSKKFNVRIEELDQYLKVLSIVRNICAHDERLYNLFLHNSNNGNIDIADTIYHQNLAITKTNQRYEKGKNDLFAIVISLKALLPSKEFKKFIKSLSEEIEKLSGLLICINIDVIYEKMGFPNNWKNI